MPRRCDRPRVRSTYEALDDVAAKGKQEPIRVWRATGARSRFGVDTELRPGSLFVGRDSELALLVETFSRALREPSAQLVTVIGEPGVGKSRLVWEFSREIDRRPDLVTLAPGPVSSVWRGNHVLGARRDRESGGGRSSRPTRPRRLSRSSGTSRSSSTTSRSERGSRSVSPRSSERRTRSRASAGRRRSPPGAGTSRRSPHSDRPWS